MLYQFSKLILGMLCTSGLLASTPSPMNPVLLGDEAYRQRENAQRAKSALDLYRTHTKQAPNDADGYWRLSMACHFVGMRIESNTDKKISLFTEGKDAAQLALKIEEDCAPCHFWKAINMALLGQEIGLLKMLFSVPEIKAHLKRAIELEPSYAFGGPHRLLGLIYQNVPLFFGGSKSQARREFELAIESSPAEPLNYLALSKLLKEEMALPKDAYMLTVKALSYPPPASDRIESVEAYQEVQSLNQQLAKQVFSE